MKEFSQNISKKPHFSIIALGILTLVVAFLLGMLFEHKSILKTAGKNILELCGFDPDKLKQSIDNKIIEHNIETYGQPVPQTYLTNLSIQENQTVSFPLVISGTADSGNWFFEGVFPVTVYDAYNKKLTDGFAGAEGEWMTTEPVSFTTKLNSARYTGPATIVFTQNDPSDGESGKPPKEVRIPVIVE